MYENIVMLSDDTHIRTQLNRFLPSPCTFFRTPEEFFREGERFSAGSTVIMIDDRFQYREAVQLCYRIQHQWPGIRIVLLLKTEADMPDTPIENGSIFYLPKPLSEAGVNKVIRRRRRLEAAASDSLIIGDSDCMQRLREKIMRLAASLGNTIITGETGSGKEVTMKELHRLCGKNLVSVNCSSLNTQIAESDLFGHHKGAFTGSTSERSGYIRRANGGILFLDEIETLTSQAQANMLRFLDSGEFYTVGGDTLNRAQVTVIAATNEPVSRLLAEGKLRRDFYMRLSVNHIHVPALREHLEDIPSLVRLKEHQMGYEASIKEMAAAYRHEWSGNVRELFNVVQRAHQENPESPAITEEIIRAD